MVIRQNIAGHCQQTFENKKFVDIPSNVLPYYHKWTFLPMIWIFTEGEDDGIESRLSSYIFSTLSDGALGKILDFGFSIMKFISLLFLRNSLNVIVIVWRI